MKQVGAFAVALGAALIFLSFLPGPEPAFGRFLGIVVGLACMLNGWMAAKGTD